MGANGGSVWMGRMHRMGGSCGLVLPKAVRDEYGVRIGDYFAIVIVGGLWVMRRIEKGMVLDRDETALAIAESVRVTRL